MILFTIEGQIGKIVLNRAEKFNSFNRQMSLALIEALRECNQDKNIRAVHISGAENAFPAPLI